MKLSKVSSARMGLVYGIIGMIALLVGYWLDETYTFDHGTWIIGASMAPGLVLGIWSGVSVQMTGLPEMVGAFNGLGGLAAALEGIGLYVDPNATELIRSNKRIETLDDSMLWVQAIATILSIVIGCMTFTGSCIAVMKLHGTIASKPRIPPFRWFFNFILAAGIIVCSILAFNGNGRGWNNRDDGLAMICVVTGLSCVWGILFVLAIGGGDMPVSISFLNSLSGKLLNATLKMCQFNLSL